MEMPNPEKPKPKIYLPEVRAIIESDGFLTEVSQRLEKIGDEENTLRHSQRIANLGYLLANHLKLPKERAQNFFKACFAHDIGKTKTPVEILKKPGKDFTDEDWEIIKKHPRDGKEILKEMLKEEEFGPRVYNPVLLHHDFQERDYPAIGIEATDFDDEDVDIDNARLLAMVDVFDRCAFGSTNIKPLSENKIEQRMAEQFNLVGDKEIISFLMDQYEIIKGLNEKY